MYNGKYTVSTNPYSNDTTFYQFIDNYYTINNNSLVNDYKTINEYNTVWTNSTSTFSTSNYNFVYDNNTLEFITGEFKTTYNNNIYGLEDYMTWTNCKNILVDTLLDMSEPYIDQEFEDSLYELVLELLYEKIKDQFEDFFNEQKFPYRKVNEIIQNIINSYHNTKKLEELNE